MIGVELFNKTNMVKVLPKYRYNGKIKLIPKATYPIEKYMVDFYRPYEKIGIVIRYTSVKEEIEPEVENIIKEAEGAKDVVDEPIKVEKITETSVPEVNESVAEEQPLEEKVSVEGTTDATYKYSNEDLESLKISDMKDILNGMGVDYSNVPNRRADFIEAILSNQ